MAMPVVPLRKRVVEVVLDLGPGSAERYRYGSGFRLGGRLVLTAAHVVAGVAVDGITVRGPDKVPHPARIVDGLAGDPDTVDLALLELWDQAAELPPPPVAVVDRNAPVPVPVEGCWAVGYPVFQELESAKKVVRETAQVWGMILPAENLVGGLLSLRVTSTPPALPPPHDGHGQSQWSGMSGAAVLAGEWLLGVVSEHAPRRGDSVITVSPLASLDRLPAAAATQWWEHLAADPERLVKLPARRMRPEPAYRATLRRLRDRTGVLQGRDRELDAIGAFATGQHNALAPLGSQHAWLVGGPWTGKTALLAEAVHALPPEVDCVAYFLTRPTGDADRERFLAAVVPQLTWLLGRDSPSTMTVHVFRQLWEQAAQHVADQERQLLLIVDGLDEDLLPGGHSVAAWLPARLPGLPARVLVASRLYPRLPDDVDPAHPLAALTPDKLHALPDSPHATRLRELADQEITQVLRRANDDLALDVLGLLTAAHGGPLAAADLATLTGSRPWKVRRVLDGEMARTLQQVGPWDTPRYTFAHETLLSRCQHHDISDPGHARRIQEWAASWRDRGWPVASERERGTPLYLLDRYLQTLYDDPQLLAALASDVAWVTAAIRTLGVNAVLTELKAACTATPREPLLEALYAVVRGQGNHLNGWQAGEDPGLALRQLCLQAAQMGYDTLAADCRTRLLAFDDPGPVLWWTTERTSPALALDLGRHGGGVEAVAVLPDGRVMSGGGDGRLLVWDLAHPGIDPAELGHGGGVKTLAVLPDGRVASSGGGMDGRLLVWDPARPGADPAEFGRHDIGVTALAVLPDGRVISGGGDGRLLVWDPARPGADPAQLGRHGGWVEALAVLQDGRVACSSGGMDRGRVLAWDPAHPRSAPAELVPRGGWVKALAVLPDGRVASSSGNQVLVWDPARPGSSPAELGGRGGDVNVMAVLPDGRVASGSGDGRLLVWDPACPGSSPTELGQVGPVEAVAVLPDGWVVSGGGFMDDGRLLVWDPAHPETGPAKLGPSGGWAGALAVLPDSRLVSGGGDGRILVWEPADTEELDLRGGRVLAVTALPDGRVANSPSRGRVMAVAALPDGRVASGDRDGRVLVWDPAQPETGSVKLGRHSDWAGAVAGLPDGRVISGGGPDDRRVLVWDPARPGSGPVKLGHHSGAVAAAAVLPDGRVITGGSDGVLLWDPAEPGSPAAELVPSGGWVQALAVLLDGRVASGGRGGQVLLWDPADPISGPVELGHHDGGGVDALAVLPDGRLASGGQGGMRLWDIESGRATDFVACSAYALAIAPSSSGARLFVGHERGGLSCWEVHTAAQGHA